MTDTVAVAAVAGASSVLSAALAGLITFRTTKRQVTSASQMAEKERAHRSAEAAEQRTHELRRERDRTLLERRCEVYETLTRWIQERGDEITRRANIAMGDRDPTARMRELAPLPHALDDEQVALLSAQIRTFVAEDVLKAFEGWLHVLDEVIDAMRDVVESRRLREAGDLTATVPNDMRRLRESRAALVTATTELSAAIRSDLRGDGGVERAD